MFPVKSERESGLLFPEFAYGGRNGFEVGLPLYWAARHNINVTLTPGYMETQGARAKLEVEYLLGKSSKGKFQGAFIRDRTGGPDEPHGKRRWALSFDHDQPEESIA